MVKRLPADTAFRDPLDLFADREEILAQFKQFLRLAQPRRFGLFAVKGNSGTGKTFLIEYLTYHICPSLSWQVGNMNFAPLPSGFRSILAALEDALRECVSAQHFEHYRSQRDRYNQSFDTYRASIYLSSHVEAKESSSLSGITLNTSVNAELRERERQLRAEWSRALIELSRKSQNALCLFVDGYSPPPDTDPEYDRWFWEELLLPLAKAAAQPVRIVTCGWEWPSNTAVKPHAHNLHLDDFGQAQIHAYLEKQGGLASSSSEEELISTFYAATKGHPLVLSLAVTYFNEFAPDERTASILQVDKPLIDEKARVEFLEERLLSRLHEPYRTLLMWGPILRSFDQPVLKALLSDATGQNLVEWNELDDRSYDRFLRYPFVRQTKITRASSIAIQYTFHELVRQVSIAALHRHHLETAERLHRNMAKYYWDIYWDDIKTGYEQEVADLEARMTPEDVAWFKKWPEQITRETSDEMFRALLEYFYHALQVKEFQIDAFERWMGLVRGAVYRWKQGRAPLLFQVVEQLRDENLLFLKGQEEPYSQYLVVYAQFLAQEARLDEARDVLREATGLIEQREEPTELAASLASIGYTYSTLGELDLALKYCERAATTLIKEGDTAKITAVLSNIGVIYLERNNPKKALDYFQQVLALGDIRDGEASLYRAYNIGRVLEEQGHLDEALDCYKASLTYISQESNLSLIARCLTQIGSIYRELGNFTEALDYYQKAFEISQHIRDSVTTAACLNGIGLIHYYQGNAGKALQFYRQALEISVELEFPRDLAAAHHNIADVYLSRRQYRRAAEQYNKALRLYERLGQGFESDVVEELERLAACNLALGEIEKTVNYKIRAQQIRNKA